MWGVGDTSAGEGAQNCGLIVLSSSGILPISPHPSSQDPTPAQILKLEQKRQSAANWIYTIVQSWDQPLDVVSLWLQGTRAALRAVLRNSRSLIWTLS